MKYSSAQEWAGMLLIELGNGGPASLCFVDVLRHHTSPVNARELVTEAKGWH